MKFNIKDSILDSFPAFIFWKDLNLKLIGVSKSVYDSLGYNDNEIDKVDAHYKNLTYGPFSNEAEELSVIKEDRIISYPCNVNIDGEDILLRVYRFPLKDNGKIIGLVNFYRRYDEDNKSINNILEQQFELLNMIPNIIFWNTVDSKIISTNSTGEKYFASRNNKAVYGNKYEEVFPIELSRKLCLLDEKVIKSNQIEKEIIIFHDNGLEKVFDVSKNPTNSNNFTFTIFTIIRDITEEYFNKKKMAFFASHDKLTGLYNRVQFEMFLGTHRNDDKIAIVMIDIDGLKLINDVFGHFKGDEMLIKTSSAIKRHIPSNSICARLGGDEFGIAMYDTDKDKIEEMMDDICFDISKIKINELPVSIAYGYKIKTSKNISIREVASIADANMYIYKNKYKNSVRKTLINSVLNLLFKNVEGEEVFTKSVMCVAEKITRSLGYNEKTVETITGAAKYHNVGKVAVDEYLKRDFDVLDSIELNEVKKHPEIGYIILSSSVDFVEYAEATYYHHVFYDGSGYPGGVKGKNIPFASRVLTISDFVGFLLTQNTSYEDIIEAIKRDSGSRYDPDICDAVIQLLTENDI